MPSDAVRRSVLEVYERVGREGSRPPPGLDLATGRRLAEDLGYPPAVLDALPAAVLDAFVGAAPLYREVDGPPGPWVADLGCGAGLDGLLLAERGFRVAALDLSAAMLGRLRAAAAGRPAAALHPLRAALPSIPLASGSAAWALLNGVANLVADRGALLAEVRRVLRPGGLLLVADLLELGEIPPELRRLPEAWAWCLAGATTPARWVEALGTAGFADAEVRVLEEFPPLGRGVIRARAA